MGFGAITAAISFMKSFAKRSMILLGILAFVIFVMPMDGVAAENTNSTLSAATNLYTRMFKVDPDTFYRALKISPNAIVATNNSGGTREGHTDPNSGLGGIVIAAAKTIFSSLGVDLTAPGKYIFFNDRLGLLSVRATDQDLDTIERAVKMLNTAAPQVHIKARFVEVTKVTKDTGKSPSGFLGQIDKDGKILLWTNPLDVFPGITTSSARDMQNPDATNAKVAVILTDINFRVAFHNLELRPDFENFGEPEAVTISGRRIAMKASAVKKDATHIGFPGNIAIITPQSQTVEFDGALDMVATVMTNSYTIDLTTTASLTNFLSIEQLTNVTVDDEAGQKINLPVIAPRFYLRQASAHLNLWDGQTVVLGNLPKHFFVGGKEVSAKPDADDKELLVFITVEIIDPAGNKIHSDDELPFAQNGIPPQPTQ